MRYTLIKNSKLALRALIVILFMIAPAVADESQNPIGDDVKNLPIFDAHMHYNQPALERYSVENIIELMDNNGVAMALVSSTPDEGTIMLWEYASGRIVPELRPYHGKVGSSNWTKAKNIDAYIDERLKKYPHEGIGEFHIYNLDTSDEPLFRKVIALAKEKDILLHVHSGTEPIRWLYSLDNEVKIIWAHAGLGEPPEEIYALMSEYPGLYAETSLRENAILGYGGEIDPEWKKIIMEFQDRLMVGSDTWVNGQWDYYSEIIASNRLWLSKLPQAVAEKIAYKNAETLFKRKISMNLTGTR